MSTSRTPASETTPDHYSYAHYADRRVAEGFDALRFGGPIGQLLLDAQARILAEVLAPVSGRLIADVGAGTGRAAIGLASAGGRVIGLDASAEMLDVARARAGLAHLSIPVGRADAHALPLADRSVDAAISLRVLMHTVNWRQCIAELCRIARWRVVVDFPAAASVATLESAARRVIQTTGRPVEAYRVMAERSVRQAFAAHGFHVVDVRRQFVLPIALHKALNRAAVTTAMEGGLRAVGLLRLLGSPVTMVAER